MVAAGQGDKTVERVVAAHHVVEFCPVGGDGVRVTEHDRNGCGADARPGDPQVGSGTRHAGRARRRTGRRESARTSAAPRAEWGVVNNRGEGGNRLVGGVCRRGFTIRRDAGALVRFEHSA